MSRPQKMPVREALTALDGWSAAPGRDAIQKSFSFENFKQAFDFMTRSARHAEELDHHPEWFNVYSRVEVTLATHDAGGVTELDVTLARLMDAAASASR